MTSCTGEAGKPPNARRASACRRLRKCNYHPTIPVSSYWRPNVGTSNRVPADGMFRLWAGVEHAPRSRVLRSAVGHPCRCKDVDQQSRNGILRSIKRLAAVSKEAFPSVLLYSHVGTTCTLGSPSPGAGMVLALLESYSAVQGLHYHLWSVANTTPPLAP